MARSKKIAPPVLDLLDRFHSSIDEVRNRASTGNHDQYVLDAIDDLYVVHRDLTVGIKQAYPYNAPTTKEVT